MAIQLGAQLGNLIAASVQFQRIERQLVVRAIIPVQQYYSRGNQSQVKTVQFLIARFHVYWVVRLVHIATTMGSLFGTARVPMRGN